MNISLRLDAIRIENGDRSRELSVDLSVQLAEGSCLLLSGPSGSGKSLTLRRIAGVTPGIDKQSHIHFVGFDFTVDARSPSPDISRQIGYIPQDLAQFFIAPKSSQEVEVGFETLNAEPQRAQADRRRLLYQMGLSTLTFSTISTLSAGEKSLLALASAFARDPQILLLDEIFFSLSDEGSERAVKQIQTFCGNGGIVVITTHDLEGTERYVMPIDHQHHEITSIMPPNHQIRTSLPARQSAPGVKETLYAIPGDDLKTPDPGGTFLFSFDDIAVIRGDVILVEGKNGAGKTTFLRHAAGLSRGWPDGAMFKGRNVADDPPQYPDDIGFVSDSPMTTAFEGVVSRYMDFFVEHSRRNIEDTRNTARHFMELLVAYGISSDMFVADLSYGQRKLLSLARCANCPSLLFVDEMPVSIDRGQQEIIATVFGVLRDCGTTIIFTTHSRHLFPGAYNRRFAVRDGWLHEESVEGRV